MKFRFKSDQHLKDYMDSCSLNANIGAKLGLEVFTATLNENKSIVEARRGSVVVGPSELGSVPFAADEVKDFLIRVDIEYNSLDGITEAERQILDDRIEILERMLKEAKSRREELK